MFNVIKISVMAMLTSVVFSQPAMARDFADIYTDCGIGAMIAPKNGAVAAVTNVTWDLGTTAISSNISSPDSCVGGQERTAAFIHGSYEYLEQDLARGCGTYLDTLMALAGYDSQTKQESIESLRNGFAKVVSEPGYSNKSRFEKAKTLYNLVYKQEGMIS